MERWCAAGLDIPGSVNVAAQQLLKEGFVDRLIALLAAHPGIAPSRLELEILESSELHDMPLVSHVIHECSRLGVTVALDDFGTGYASLSYLKWLPVDVLKIDQTFVRDMLDDAEDLAILEGVLALATAFRRQVIAEGVETVEHGLLLLRLGCQVAQGYCIARPMPAQELPHWLASWRPDPQWLHVFALDPVDRPLLYAGAEHSAFVADIDDFLGGRHEGFLLCWGKANVDSDLGCLQPIWVAKSRYRSFKTLRLFTNAFTPRLPRFWRFMPTTAKQRWMIAYQSFIVCATPFWMDSTLSCNERRAA